MPIEEIVLLLVAACAAGALNAAAGGGSFLTLPALVFVGVPPVVANATGTTALLPGYAAAAWAQRKELRSPASLSLPVLALICVIPAACGALLLLHTGDRTFDIVIPWLLLAATILFAAGPVLKRAASASATGKRSPIRAAASMATVSLYGGYFNGGLGIVLLATLGLIGETNINTMNAIKSLVSSLITIVSVTVYAVGGLTAWPQALLMAVGATVGGHFGARIVSRLPATLVRVGIVVVGIVMTTVFFLRA